jgi:Tol biopolymer transport system component
MTLPAGTRLGPYEILAPLGAGAMGEVYRAVDTALKRQVAIKLLGSAGAAEADHLARFQREAEILASLNHPHIAAIYGVEDDGRRKALVMELVDGPTLADRLARGAIPLDDAIPIARQIADALKAAHDRGVIHRDLKPANIKVRDDGTVKVLDFGIAKLAGAADGSADTSDAATMASGPLTTGLGVIMGTAAYMSPEQARGLAVDRRTDVWAFGALLYEMLSGKRAFQGTDVSVTIAAVLRSAPDWNTLPSGTPPRIVRLIRECLEPDRASRIDDMAVVRFLLAQRAANGIVSDHGSVGADPRRPLTLPLAAGALVVGLLGGWFAARRPAAPPIAASLQLSVSPADQLIGSSASVRPARTALALSPDGRTVVFAGVHGGRSRLYVRSLDRAEAVPIPGTDDAAAPFVSPDGAWFGFWVGSKIEKVAASGGAPATVCDAAATGTLGAAATGTFGATWGADGTIVFATRTGLFRVPPEGGTAAAIAMAGAPENERAYLPHFLPDGKAFLFTALTGRDWNDISIVLQPLDGGERRTILRGGADARYVDGHLVYLKAATLTSVPFDLRSRQTTGAPAVLVEDVMQAFNAANGSDATAAGQFDVSEAGTLVYAAGGPFAPLTTQPMWVDRSGQAQPVSGMSLAPYLGPRLSPDGQRIAVSIRRQTPRGIDVWVHDLTRGVATRLTFDGFNGQPLWSPDGKRVAYATTGTQADGLYQINADGSGTPERIGGDGTPSSWSAALDAIALLRRGADGTTSIWVNPLGGDRTPRLFLQSRFTLRFPTFSPDGRWMAYISNESGSYELYSQAYPGPGGKVRVSSAGAFDAAWVANGRELLFRSFPPSGQRFWSAGIRSTAPLALDTPRLLFEAKLGEYDSTVPDRAWDVTADGQRMLLGRLESADKPVTMLQVVLNWTETLTRGRR